MAKIQEIRIENFRGIEQLTLSFSNPKGTACDIVVIGGPNGTGKTAVLEAILVGTGNSKLVSGSVNRTAVRHGATDYSIVIRTDASDVFEATSSDHSKARLKVGYCSSNRVPGELGTVGPTVAGGHRRPEKVEGNRLKRLKQYLVNVWTRSMHARLGSLAANNGDSKLSAYEDAVTKLKGIWQRFYEAESFEVRPVNETDEEAPFDLFLRQRSGDLLSVDQLSSGQMELLLLAGTAIIEKDSFDILVIDEPELHLDPAWHVQIVRSLHALSPSTQLIVATHSSDIFDSAMTFERHFLVDDDDPRARFWPHSRSHEVA